MEALLIALAVPALGGLAWLAYNHPVQYLPIGQALNWATTMIFALVAAWTAGARQAFVALIPMVEDIDRAQKAVDGISMHWLWGSIAVFAVLGYISFLNTVVTKLMEARAGLP
jgi:hypothetical protein